MSIKRSSLVLLCAMAAALAALPGAAAAQDLIWRGRSGGFDITWGEHELSARRASDGALVFSARGMFHREVRSLTAHPDTVLPVRGYGQSLTLLSVVGSVISLLDERSCDCGGVHERVWARFVAYDLARGTAARPFELSATRLVSERDLLRALRSDRLMQQAMDSAHVHAFTTLRGLTSRLSATAIWPGDECGYELSDSFPAAWAAHHLENGRVALRFSLSHSLELCRGRYVQVGVLAAPLPRSLADFRAADARRAGFLMKDARAIAGQRSTAFDWRARDR